MNVSKIFTFTSVKNLIASNPETSEFEEQPQRSDSPTKCKYHQNYKYTLLREGRNKFKLP